VGEEGSALQQETALQREWFRRLTISGAVTAAGFTALLAALGVLLGVKVLLVGAGIVGGVFLVALLALILARRGGLLLPAQLLAGAGVAHAVVQSYLFPFAAPTLAVSAVLSIASVLPYVHGRPLRGLVVWSILSALAIAALPSVSPFAGVVPHAAQQVIAIAGLPAVTILTSLLLLQFSERIRRAREDETAAHVEAEQTRRALERTSQRLRIALSAAGIGIWDLDPRSGMLSLDHRCASIFGLPAGGPLDYAGFLSLIVADDQPRVGAAIHRAVHGDGAARYELEFRIRDASGAAERWLRCTAQLLVDGMQVVGLIGTAQDLTSAKRTEAELRSAKERAEDASHAKDEFLAMLGHELRNPLAPMLTALELLRVRLGEAGARERDVIQRQVRNLAQLVDDVLDVAHIRKGRMTIDTNSIYVRQIVSKGLELVTPMLEERRHRLEVDIQPPSLVVVGDERRLIQAVTNLLTNAVKYTDPGGAIRVSVANEGADTVLRVADTGVGISAALLPRVFDLFVQGERTPDRREGGLGLGLPIVRSIVERHGGTVSAFSDGVGRGTEFVIRLPSADAHTPMPVASAVVASERVAASTPKILIVDDNRDAADSLHALLRDHGFACASALDGPSGLETVAAFEPDAVLLDIGLPGLDGYEVARRIRALPQGEKYLLVAVTGYGEERDKERSAQAGFDAHLVKPVDFDQLLAIIHAIRRPAEPEGAGAAEADTPPPAEARSARALSGSGAFRVTSQD
jgi:signal transduction histidine kinase/FixJ family two-component response regulator